MNKHIENKIEIALADRTPENCINQSRVTSKSLLGQIHSIKFVNVQSQKSPGENG